MEQSIRCIRIHEPDSAEPDSLWRLDEKGAAESFFFYLLHNDLYGTIDVVDLTKKEWEEAESIGKEMA